MANMKNKENPNPEKAGSQKHADARPPITTIRRPFRARISEVRPTKLAKTLVEATEAGARIFGVAAPEAVAKADLQLDPTSQAATAPVRRSSSTSTTTTNDSKDRWTLPSLR